MIFGKLVFEVESDFIFKKSSKQSAIKSMEKAVLGAKNFNGFGNDFSNDDRAIINSRIKKMKSVESLKKQILELELLLKK